MNVGAISVSYHCDTGISHPEDSTAKYCSNFFKLTHTHPKPPT